MNADIAPTTASHLDPTQPLNPTRHFTIRLSATPRGARLARHLAAEQLHTWGWPYDTEANHIATLLVSELATNAALHGRVRGRDFRLSLTLHPEDATLRIELTDPRPEGRPPPAPSRRHRRTATQAGGSSSSKRSPPTGDPPAATRTPRPSGAKSPSRDCQCRLGRCSP